MIGTGRAIVVVCLVALAGALVVAILSRAPARFRNDRPGREATDPSLGATFTHEEVARNGAYRLPGYAAAVAGIVIEIVTLVVLARGPLARLAERLGSLPGGVATRAAVLGIVIAVVGVLVALPMSFVRGYVIEHSWGLSTQDLGGWLSDVARSLLVGAVIAGISAAVFFTVVSRMPRFWWIASWAAFAALSVLFVFIFPVVVAPLFNKFTPLEDPTMKKAIVELADRAGVDVDEVLVADASRRSTAENAYVAGLGETKRVVVYDTLLESGGEPETLFVVAHELGHEKEHHVIKGLLLEVVGLFVGFGLLAWLAGRDWFLSWAGASSIADVRALPLLLLYLTVAGLLALPVQSAFSRSWERRADEIAVDLTRDKAVAVRSFRRLAFSNLADLRPPRIAVLMFFTHPPIPDRIQYLIDDPASAAGGSFAGIGAVQQD